MLVVFQWFEPHRIHVKLLYSSGLLVEIDSKLLKHIEFMSASKLLKLSE